MSARAAIEIEAVLRRERSDGELRSVLEMALDEVPRPRRTAARLVALAACEVGANVVVALAARSLIADAVASESSVDVDEPISAIVVIIAAVAALAALIATRSRQVYAHDVVLDCRHRAVVRAAANITDADYEDLSGTPMAGLREILMTDIDHVYRFGVDLVSKVVVIVLWAAAATVLTAWLSWPILIVLAAVCAVTALLVWRSLRRHSHLTNDRFVRLAELSERAREVVEVERVVLTRQLDLGHYFVDRFVARHGDYVEILREQQRLTASLRASLVGLNAVAFVVVIVVGSILISSGDLTVAALIAVSFAISQLLVAVVDLGDYVQRGAETVTAGRRLGAYWDRDDTESSTISRERSGEPTASTRASLLSAREVGFAYGTEPVLHDLDLDLVRGEPACLTGATGAGKSTLGLLLSGVLTPDSGRLTIDDHPLDASATSMLYIGARPVLVEGSVVDNLLLDDSRPNGPDVEERLHRLFRHLESWDMAFDEPIVTAQGTGLSSGQAQTVALARAWIRDPDVVVFDEATSSLDMATEALVQDEMTQWLRERITLAISHRDCPWVSQASHRLRMGTSSTAMLTIQHSTDPAVRPSANSSATHPHERTHT